MATGGLYGENFAYFFWKCDIIVKFPAVSGRTNLNCECVGRSRPSAVGSTAIPIFVFVLHTFFCRSFYIFVLVLLAMGSLHPPAVHLARCLTFSPPTPTDFFACTWTPLLTMAQLPRVQPTFRGRYVSGLVAPSRRMDLPPPILTPAARPPG